MFLFMLNVTPPANCLSWRRLWWRICRLTAWNPLRMFTVLFTKTEEISRDSLMVLSLTCNISVCVEGSFCWRCYNITLVTNWTCHDFKNLYYLLYVYITKLVNFNLLFLSNVFKYDIFNWLHFIGTENAADEDSRKKIAVDKDTGGSYVVSKHLAGYQKESVK